MAEYLPQKKSSYFEISNYLKNSKMIFNPKNDNDNQCFKYCI